MPNRHLQATLTVDTCSIANILASTHFVHPMTTDFLLKNFNTVYSLFLLMQTQILEKSGQLYTLLKQRRHPFCNTFNTFRLLFLNILIHLPRSFLSLVFSGLPSRRWVSSKGSNEHFLLSLSRSSLHFILPVFFTILGLRKYF